MASVMRLTPEQDELRRQLDRDPFSEWSKRDQWNRPVIDDRVYRRPSTQAKALDDASGLVAWKAKTVALGATQSKFTLDRLAMLDADDPDNRYAVKDLVEELSAAGGGEGAANYGALIHALLEVDDNPDGFRWGFDQDLWVRVASDPHFSAIRVNYRAEMARLGFTFDPQYVEVPLVSDDLLLAGTCDRLATLPDGRVRVFDVKTNEGRVFPTKFLAWLLQLHVYASASYIYDPETDTKSELPENFDRDTGYICVVDRATTEVEVYELDLRPGARLIELAEEVEQARKGAIRYAQKLTEPLAAGPDIRDDIRARIAVLDSIPNTFAMQTLMQRWQAAGLPKLSQLTDREVEHALELVEAQLREESVTSLSLDDVLQRLAELPEDLRNGVEAHAKWVDRSVWESPDRAEAQLQADVDVTIAEQAFDKRRRIVQDAASRVPAENRAEFRDWLTEGLHIAVDQPKEWSKRCVRSIDALSRAVELNYITPGGEIIDADVVLRAVRKKFGTKAKGPANEAFAEAAKWLGVPKPKSYDAGCTDAAIVGYALCHSTDTV